MDNQDKLKISIIQEVLNKQIIEIIQINSSIIKQTIIDIGERELTKVKPELKLVSYSNIILTNKENMPKTVTQNLWGLMHSKPFFKLCKKNIKFEERYNLIYKGCELKGKISESIKPGLYLNYTYNNKINDIKVNYHISLHVYDKIFKNDISHIKIDDPRLRTEDVINIYFNYNKFMYIYIDIEQFKLVSDLILTRSSSTTHKLSHEQEEIKLIEIKNGLLYSLQILLNIIEQNIHAILQHQIVERQLSLDSEEIKQIKEEEQKKHEQEIKKIKQQKIIENNYEYLINYINLYKESSGGSLKYYNKYIKYKIKYLNLKNNQLIN